MADFVSPLAVASIWPNTAGSSKTMSARLRRTYCQLAIAGGPTGASGSPPFQLGVQKDFVTLEWRSQRMRAMIRVGLTADRLGGRAKFVGKINSSFSGAHGARIGARKPFVASEWQRCAGPDERVGNGT